MAQTRGWVSIARAEELLEMDRKELFRMRDDGTLKLGPHFAAFPGCMSRDSYRWNVEAVRKHLRKQEKMAAVA